MLEHLIVAGADFHLQWGPNACDFAAMADRRARALLHNGAPQTTVRLLDAAAGTVTRYSMVGGHVRIDIMGRDYGSVWEGTRYEAEAWDHAPDARWRGRLYPSQRILARDQLDLMDILYVYDEIQKVGRSNKGTLGEVHFFTHGTPDGPQLLGSRHADGHSTAGSQPMWFPSAGITQLTRSFAPPHGPLVAGAPLEPYDGWRDPCDTDARVLRDLELYAEDSPFASPDEFHAAFAPGGKVIVHGGTFSLLDDELLVASAWSSGVGRDGPLVELVRVTGLSDAALHLVTLLFERDPSVVVRDGVVRMPRGRWDGFLRGRLERTWAARMANFMRIPVFAPPPGLLAEPAADGAMAIRRETVQDAMLRVVARAMGPDRGPDEAGYVRFLPS